MPVRATRPVVAIALTAILALSACGGGDEPPPKEKKSSSKSSETTNGSTSEREAVRTYREYWKLANSETPSKPPGNAAKRLLSSDLFASDKSFAERMPEVAVEGRDTLLSTEAEARGASTVTVEACYEVHRRWIAQADGESWRKGDNLRTDQNGKPIKPGTNMVDMVTMKRGSTDSDRWRVHKVDVGSKPTCEGERQQG